MSSSFQSSTPSSALAPCIVDQGIVVNKRDMERLLADLGRVRYIHSQDGCQLSEGEGSVQEVFADPQRSTMVANRALYLNVYSFDYLELHPAPDNGSYIDLVQDSRRLRLVPLSDPLQDNHTRSINTAALEAMIAEVLSANLDVQLDDDALF
jgi:hypothetical protein